MTRSSQQNHASKPTAAAPPDRLPAGFDGMTNDTKATLMAAAAVFFMAIALGLSIGVLIALNVYGVMG